ncbi:response regulator [Thermospira aquatica]|uniref:Response regulator n=1 Tax=Thermospira aquatica TaxID=2828656 RepID=A0AAX3BE52_9SPIR|nr:response regulator [Thermospira aquatica]URA10388.1 response regulator [Thermospira aquatica]
MQEESKKILIVEDESIIAWNIARLVEKNSYKVCEIARSFDEAIRAFQRHLPDVIIMDIVLQGEKSGIDLAQEILRERYVPIICLSAYSTGAYIERLMELNIFGYLLKPFEERELMVMLQLALNETERARVLSLEREKKDALIKKLDNYFRVLADSLPFFLIDFTEEGQVFYANALAREKLNLSEETKPKLWELFGENEAIRRYYDQTRAGKSQLYKLISCAKGENKACWFLSFWYPIELPGEKVSQGVRFLALPLQEWLDHLLLPREQLWEQFKLTSREIDILRGILQGKRIQTIANENFISLPTVKYHINQLYNKLGVGDREELYQVLQEKLFADMPPDVFFAYLFTSVVSLNKK